MESTNETETVTMDTTEASIDKDIINNNGKKKFDEKNIELVSSIVKKTKKAPAKKSKKIKEENCDEDYDDCEDLEERSEDESDAGSLEEFIIDEDENEESEEEGSCDDEKELTKEEEMSRDLEDISKNNIVTGKRVRKPVVRFEDSVFNSEEYKKMLLCDIPDDELDAVLESDEEEEYSDEDDEEYEGKSDDDENDVESEVSDSDYEEEEEKDAKKIKVSSE